MGYDNETIEIWVRLSADNGERQRADREARDRLREEIRQLILADKDYERIAEVGP